MANKLKNESSLYLKQHENNPVSWYPWGEEAFSKASNENKPIFLSIGYSSCHWCHVMAHECFEDNEVATLLNQFFVCIKVDKEERPDIDHIYQKAHYIFAQRPGGWPLSVFMTPKQEPFFIATYIPKLPKFNMQGLMQILPKLSELYLSEKDMLSKQTDQIRQIFNKLQPEITNDDLFSKEHIHQVREEIIHNLDHTNGGFKGAPKFPNEAIMNYLIKSKNQDSIELMSKNIKKIMQSGLFDHVEGGFFRYCVDDQWQVPHYEKMLYNSAQLIELITHLTYTESSSQYLKLIEMTVDWLKNNMLDKQGYFYSSMDADSLNDKETLEEGFYYNFSPEDETLNSMQHIFQMDGNPNYESELWHLNLRNFEDIDQIDKQRQLLKKTRQVKVKPTIDQKLVVSWNAMMIKSLLYAGRVLKKDEWIQLAQKNLDYLTDQFFITKSSLKNNQHKESVLFLDDYVFYLEALIESMQSNFKKKDYEIAFEIGNQIIEKFDSENGALYFTAHDHEKLFEREIISEDNATPSANGVAALIFQKLSILYLDNNFFKHAEKILRHLNHKIRTQPSSHPSLMTALEYFYGDQPLITFFGSPDQISSWKNNLPNHLYQDHLILFLDTKKELHVNNKTINSTYLNEGAITLCKKGICYPACKNVDELLSLITLQ
jgi:uncharacterized protein YyaL (SSP411 family)